MSANHVSKGTASPRPLSNIAALTIERGEISRRSYARLKALEAENAKLKRLLAEAMLDNAMLKDVASKKW